MFSKVCSHQSKTWRDILDISQSILVVTWALLFLRRQMDEKDAFLYACFHQLISKPECSGNPIVRNSVCDVGTFFTNAWEQNQTIIFQLQGNLVTNFLPQKPNTQTKDPQNLGYFLGEKKSNLELLRQYLDEFYVAQLVACEFLSAQSQPNMRPQLPPLLSQPN